MSFQYDNGLVKPQLKRSKEILLLNPPFGTLDNPYISIPVLASYLKSKGIKVSGADINQQFFYHFLNRSQIVAGKKWIERRFLDLNNRVELGFREMTEYKILVRTLMKMHKNRKALTALLNENVDFFSILRKTDLKNFCTMAATLPYFPEYLLTEPFVLLFSRFSAFSSEKIIENVDSHPFYERVMQEILSVLLAEKRPLIAGLSVVFENQVLPAFLCAKIIKEMDSDIHVTMGGPIISIHMRELADTTLFKYVDSFVLDEGEVPLERLYGELSSGNTPSLANVPSLIWSDHSRVNYNAGTAPLKLEDLPVPDFTVFNLDQYLTPRDTLVIPFRLSSGCYWRKCAFCKTDLSFCRHYQQPAVEFIFEQLREVIDQTGINSFHFSDESSRPDILEGLCKKFLAEGIMIKWFAHTRIDKALTRERCSLFHKAGCEHLTVGVEALNDRLLKLMRKGITVSLIKDVLENIKGTLRVRAYMIMGFPTETMLEACYGFHQLKELVRHHQLSGYHYSLFQLTYGSNVWKHPDRYGITDIHASAGLDLAPDIHAFTGQGMSREEAFLLFYKFSGLANYIKKEERWNSVMTDGNRHPINFNMKELGAAIQSILHKLDSSGYGQWLDLGNRYLKPINRG